MMTGNRGFTDDWNKRSGYTKRALKHDKDGQGGMFLDCECGNKLPIPAPFGETQPYTCRCGIKYDSAGWIIARPEQMPVPPKCGCNEYPECTHMLYFYQGFKAGQAMR